MDGKAEEVSAFQAKTRLSLDLTQVLASFREVRKRIPGTLKIRELIEEGRRY